jgi:toxin-antitoxin system PIN domain toxin
MNLPDVNILVALYRPDHVHHHSATEWWTSTDEPFTVPDAAWSGFIRTATNRRIWVGPASASEAWEFAHSVMEQSNHRSFRTNGSVLGHFERLCREVNAHGNLVSDAYLGACALAVGGTLVTFDRDFRKFDGLRVSELSA